MSVLTPQPFNTPLPQCFPHPRHELPHPVALEAAQHLQQRLPSLLGSAFSITEHGHMFGVLVVQDAHGQTGYLAAFAEQLHGHWQMPGFVGPICANTERLSDHDHEETQLSERIASSRNELQQQQLDYTQALTDLKRHHQQRKQQRHQQRAQQATPEQLHQLAIQSQHDKRELQALHQHWRPRLAQTQTILDALNADQRRHHKRQLQQTQASYRLINARGEHAELKAAFPGLPIPTGAGDCAASKLVHHALTHGLTPIALTEFWWGATDDTLRRHGHSYPPCRSKCQPLLDFMLQGLARETTPPRVGHYTHIGELEYIYEDDDIVIVNKPAGMLSVPGTDITDSVLTHLQQRYPEASGPLLLHRLDMCTSGLLLAAKHSRAHTHLQHQFENRSIQKRYVALLDTHHLPQPIADRGSISLPLRVNLDDRPRHQVCHTHGKPALTHWQVIARNDHTTRVHFHPVSGRTHQLRIHAAHPQGLNAPITGDSLYGQPGERLMLHAEQLCFTHPITGQRLQFEAEVLF